MNDTGSNFSANRAISKTIAQTRLAANAQGNAVLVIPSDRGEANRGSLSLLRLSFSAAGINAFELPVGGNELDLPHDELALAFSAEDSDVVRRVHAECQPRQG